jgi:hypothetical protein
MVVARHVLDADDSSVDFKLGHPIDEQKRIAMYQDTFDGGVVEGQRQVHAGKRLYWQHP